MSKLSKKERREALRKRQQDNINNREKGGTGKGILDLSDYDKVEFYKPKKGRGSIDLLMYEVSTDNHPQGIKPGYPDYLLDVWVHRFVGPDEVSIICLKKTFGKPCPICDEASNMKISGADEDTIKQLQPQRRCIYNVIDLDNEDKGIQLFEISYFLFEREWLEEAEAYEDEIITPADLEDGRTISYRGSEEKLGKNSFIKFKSISFEKRELYPEDYLDEVYPLDAMLIIPTYEEAKNQFMGVAADDEEEEEQPRRSRRRRNEPDEDEEESKPRGRTRRERKEPEPEPEEKPARRQRTRREKKEEEPTEEKKITNSECPYGYDFGHDCDEKKECMECDEWQRCADEQDRLIALSKEK